MLCGNVAGTNIYAVFVSKKDKVMITKKDKNQWKLGIVEKVMPGKDRVIRVVRLRAGRHQLERPTQHLFPLELSCNIEENTKTKLNPETPVHK